MAKNYLEEAPSDSFIAKEKLYLNADQTKVVEEGDPEAAFLFTTPGKRVSKEDAERLGLVKKAEPKADKAKAAPANKAKTESEETKDN